MERTPETPRMVAYQRVPSPKTGLSFSGNSQGRMVLYGWGREALANESKRLFPSGHPAVELCVLHGLEDFSKQRAWREPHGFKVIPSYQTLGAKLFGRGLSQEAADVVVRLQVTVACQAIQPMQFQMLGEPPQGERTAGGPQP